VKLTDRGGRWLPRAEPGPGVRHGTGVTFTCPHCAVRVNLYFTAPVDGGPPAATGGPGQPSRLYTREGTTLAELTLVEVLELRQHGRWTLRGGVFERVAAAPATEGAPEPATAPPARGEGAPS
jgi:hypothetical protein